MSALLRNKYLRFGIVSLIYILFVIWLGNYWYLIGIAIIFDLYITRKVNWTFWKKRNGKNSAVVEWLDALIFAVVAVTLINIFLFQNYKIPTPSMESTMMVGDHLYVSKVSYGPRAPITPLSFPFAQNRMLGGESYLKWIQLDYKRLAGFGEVKRNDIVVFNFPAGDTVVLENPAVSYYSIVRDYAFSMAAQRNDPEWEKYLDQGRLAVRSSPRFHIVDRPVDRRDNYIKRCVAVPGDSLHIIHGQVYINGEPQPAFKGIQHIYFVHTNGRPLNPRALSKYDIPAEFLGIQNNPRYAIPLTEARAAQLQKEVSDIVKIEKMERLSDNFQLFPHSEKYKWSEDNFGPIWLPKKGSTIELTEDNLIFYKHTIEAYENCRIEVRNGKVLVDGKESTQYTFKMNYYWMMGDNRHSSSDSRFWGYVPQDHIIGKPKLIWLSIDKEKKFLKKIRFERMFRGIDAAV